MSRGGPTVARLQLGAELRALRHTAGLDGDEAARQIGGSAAKISRIEGGQLPVKETDLTALLDLYQVRDPKRSELRQLAGQTRESGWWDDFSDPLTGRMRATLSLEAEAALIMVYEPQAVPALLQTSEYARAVSKGHDPDDMRWRGGLTLKTLARRRAILQTTSPPRLWVVVHEAALRRAPDRNVRIARAQLDALRTASLKQHITLQILPEGSTAALTAPGPFSILRFDPRDVKDTVLIEQLGDIHTLNRPSELDAHNYVWNLLATQAMDQETTRALLADVDSWFAGIAADGNGPGSQE